MNPDSNAVGTLAMSFAHYSLDLRGFIQGLGTAKLGVATGIPELVSLDLEQFINLDA